MSIRYHNDDSSYSLKSKRVVSAWLKDVIEQEGYKTGDISYVFCSREKHLAMNREYLGHDYYTDVITFDYSDLKDTKTVSGDVFIDPETVAENASGYGVAPREEMLRVVLHGVLHLCGHGDKTAKEQKAMRAREDKYLNLFSETVNKAK